MRISLVEACALLSISRQTFYRQYLNPRRRRWAYAYFGIARDGDTRRLTLSAARVRAYLAAVIYDPTWAGPHCPPGAWGRRVRGQARDARRYREREQPSEAPPPRQPRAPESPLAATPLPDPRPQGDLFAP